MTLDEILDMPNAALVEVLPGQMVEDFVDNETVGMGTDAIRGGRHVREVLFSLRDGRRLRYRRNLPGGDFHLQR